MRRRLYSYKMGIGILNRRQGAIDKTTKMFYGGRQARPDGDYSRVIVGPKGVSEKRMKY